MKGHRRNRDVIACTPSVPEQITGVLSGTSRLASVLSATARSYSRLRQHNDLWCLTKRSKFNSFAAQTKFH